MAFPLITSLRIQSETYGLVDGAAEALLMVTETATLDAAGAGPAETDTLGAGTEVTLIVLGEIATEPAGAPSTYIATLPARVSSLRHPLI